MSSKNKNNVRFKAVYNNELYNVRAINWDIGLLSNQGNSVFLSKYENTSQDFEYIQVSLDKVEILQPIAKDTNGILLYKGDIIKKSIFYDGLNEKYIDEPYAEEVGSGYLDAVIVGILNFTASKGAYLKKAVSWTTTDINKPRTITYTGNSSRFIQSRSTKIGNFFENPEMLYKDYSTNAAGVTKSAFELKERLKGLSPKEQMVKIFQGRVIDEKNK